MLVWLFFSVAVLTRPLGINEYASVMAESSTDVVDVTGACESIARKPLKSNGSPPEVSVMVLLKNVGGMYVYGGLFCTCLIMSSRTDPVC